MLDTLEFPRAVDKLRGAFYVAVGNLNDFMAVRNRLGKVVPGSELTLTVVPKQEMVATLDVTKYTTEIRECRYLDETTDGSIFGVYTKSACEFECALNEAK